MQGKIAGLLGERVSSKNDSMLEDLNSPPLTMGLCLQCTIHCPSKVLDKYFYL